ncbi:MAG TPA: FecR family protein, partial [Burkholderiaceae bacterium]|nr:FecR family protein [Burkholderiaceae bacterium]
MPATYPPSPLMHSSSYRLANRWRRLMWLMLALFLTAGCATRSVAYPERTDERAPPWLAGRVAYASGDVQIVQPGEVEETRQWRPAVVNDVVSAATSIATGGDSRAELRVGGHAFRLGEVSRLVVRGLDSQRSTVQLDVGSLNVRWRDFEPNAHVDVLTPTARVELRGAGRFRVDTRGDSTVVTVFEGRAHVANDGGGTTVGAGRSVTITNDAFSFGGAVITGLDDWALARDERIRPRVATRYVSPWMTGYEDLDEYGQWVDEPQYGTVWIPTAVDPGWAPYRYGQWRWVSPWGWTWVDYAPWGFAPSHYGRWVMVSNRWAWWPGAYVARPVYAPALVAFSSH